MSIGRATQFTQAGGAKAIAAGQVCLQAIVLTPAAAAAVAEIKEGGTGGTVVLTLQAAANGASVVVNVPIWIQDPYLSNITGAGGLLTVVM